MNRNALRQMLPLGLGALLLLCGCTKPVGPLTGTSPWVTLAATRKSGHAPLHVSFTGSITEGSSPIVSLAWDFGDGETSGMSGAVTHIYTSPGSYLARLTVTDSEGHPSDGAIEIHVINRPPIASCRFSDDAPLVGTSVILDARGSIDLDGEIVDVLWEPGDGSTLRGSKVSHVYESEGVYTLRLTVTDDLGDTDTVSHTFTVHLDTGGGGCGGGSGVCI